jgi:hypothetical protein
VELLWQNGLESKLNAKDKDGKTVLDWAIERRLILMLNLKKSESDRKMEDEYKDVIKWLFSKDVAHSDSNKTIYSHITGWEIEAPANLRQNLPPNLRQELRQWRQKL